jgi:hypothetical protein
MSNPRCAESPQKHSLKLHRHDIPAGLRHGSGGWKWLHELWNGLKNVDLRHCNYWFLEARMLAGLALQMELAPGPWKKAEHQAEDGHGRQCQIV